MPSPRKKTPIHAMNGIGRAGWLSRAKSRAASVSHGIGAAFDLGITLFDIPGDRE
jgi:hypothetical protein